MDEKAPCIPEVFLSAAKRIYKKKSLRRVSVPGPPNDGQTEIPSRSDVTSLALSIPRWAVHCTGPGGLPRRHVENNVDFGDAGSWVARLGSWNRVEREPGASWSRLFVSEGKHTQKKEEEERKKEEKEVERKRGEREEGEGDGRR